MRALSSTRCCTALVLLGIGVACSVPVPASTCDEQHPCPEGYLCQQQVCVPASSAACGVDAPCPGGFVCDTAQGVCVEEGELRCGTVGIFTDAFDDGVPCEPWGRLTGNEDSTDYATEEGGELVFTLDPGNSGMVRDIRCNSRLAADLRGDALEVQLVQGVKASINGHTSFSFYSGDGERLEFYAKSTELSFYYYLTEGPPENQTYTDYDPTSPLWLRLREQQGHVLFETSPDHESWESHLQVPTPAFVERGYLEITAWSTAGSTEVGVVRYAHLGAAGGPADWCPTARLQDGFDRSALGRVWEEAHESSQCSVVMNGEALDMQTASNDDFACAVATRSAHRLSESDLWFELVSPSERATYAGLWLYQRGGPRVDCGFRGGALWLSVARAPGDDGYFEWQEPADQTRWLRVSQRGTTVSFYRRADVADEWDFVIDAIEVPPIEAARVYLELVSDWEVYDWPTPSLRALFDNVNLPEQGGR